MNFISVLRSTGTNLLIRTINSEKCYVYFDVSVFNVGTVVSVKLSDNYRELHQDSDEFVFENCDTTKYYIIKELMERESFTKREKTIFNRYKKYFNLD